MPDSARAKDWWDKLDVIGKILSGALLAVIALIIKSGADSIASAMHEGELVQSLIADLTTKDETTRQDLALIALNHAVGRRNPELVVEIAERLVVDTTRYSAGDRAAKQALGSVAFDILQKRAPARADSLKKALEQRAVATLSDSSTRAAVRSRPDTSRVNTTPPGADSAAQAVTDLLAPLSSSVVFIQFQGAVQRSTIDELRSRLDRSGFVAPGIERISPPFASSIRYFHPEDRVLADSVARITKAFVSERRLRVPSIPIWYVANHTSNVKLGQIEVWLSVQ